MTFQLHVDDMAAIRLFEKSIDRDPLSQWTYFSLAYVELVIGEFREAEAAARKAIALKFNDAHVMLGWVFLESHQATAAASECSQVTVAHWRDGCLAMAYHDLGRKDDADALLAQLERNSAATDPYEIARVHAYRGEADQALVWLERAYVQRDFQLTFVGRDPMMRNITGDSRFKAFLRKMNLPE